MGARRVSPPGDAFDQGMSPELIFLIVEFFAIIAVGVFMWRQ